MANFGGGSGRWARTATTCGAAVLSAALFVGQAAAAPVPPPQIGFSVTEVQARLQDLYRQAEQATERFNTTNERRATQQTKVNDVRAGIVSTQQQIASQKDEIGRIARLQYTTHGVDPLLTLMLTSDPAEFLRRAPTFARINQTQADTIARQMRAEQQLKGMQRVENAELAETRRLEEESEKARSDIQGKVTEAESLLATLTPEQLIQLEQYEAQVAQAGQAQLEQYGILSRPDQLTTSAAQKAITYALGKLGLPYIWGGEGPVGYDCSGLTSQAWLAGGVRIPRTSQEQWARLPRVPVADMRPGDLIVYYGDASHIGMYLGNGLMIHAPRPGRTITIAKAGSMPILGVVRPDGGAGVVPAPAIPNVPQAPAPPPAAPVTPPPSTPPPTTPPVTPPPVTTTPPPTTPTNPGTGTPTDPGTGTPTDPGTGTPTDPGTGTPTDPNGTPTPTGSATETPGTTPNPTDSENPAASATATSTGPS